MMTIGHREAENTAKQLRDVFESRVHDDIVVPLGDIDYFRMQHAYIAKSSTNFLLDVIIKQNELIADLRQTSRPLTTLATSADAEPEHDTDNHTDAVSHPDHYMQHAKECIVEMLIIFGLDNFITFCTMNAWKYRYRAGSKDGNSADQDNAKADRYIEYAVRAKEIIKYNLPLSRLTGDEYWE